jgi:hypothetical protein
MKKEILIIFFLFLTTISYAQISISEIMYNPIDKNEWIEIIVNETFNFSNTELKDNYYTDQIVCCSFNKNCNYVIQENEYVIIFDQDTTINVENLSNYFCVDDNSIGNGLGNSYDQILILKNNTLYQNITYDISVEKGNSLSLINHTFIESFNTIGQENLIYYEQNNNNEYVDLNIINNLDNVIYAGSEYKLFKIENLNYPEYNNQINISFYVNITNQSNILYEDISYPTLKSYTTTNTGKFSFEKGNYKICGNIINSTISDLNNGNFCYNITVIDTSNISCNVSLDIIIDDKIFDDNEKIYFEHVLNNESFPFVIKYWVEDLFGKDVKKKVETTNTNKKTYTPKIDETDRILILNSELEHIACNNSNQNNIIQNFLLIKGDKNNDELVNTESQIKQNIVRIKELNSEKFNFGDRIYVNLEVEKGNSAKSVVKLIVKSDKIVSDESKIYFEDKNINYKSKTSVVLKPNCDNKYHDGSYNLIVEGLDNYITKKIKISGKAKYCPKIETDVIKITEEDNLNLKQNKKLVESNKTSYEELNLQKQDNKTNIDKKQNKLTGKVVYESSSQKMKNYAIYFILAVIILAIYLLSNERF